jgi:hypothetical protein
VTRLASVRPQDRWYEMGMEYDDEFKMNFASVYDNSAKTPGCGKVTNTDGYT